MALTVLSLSACNQRTIILQPGVNTQAQLPERQRTYRVEQPIIQEEILINKKDKDGKNVKSGLQSIIDKLVKKNIIHKNNGSRKKAKFVRMIKELS